MIDNEHGIIKVCRFKLDSLHGRCITTYADGLQIESQWKDGLNVLKDGTTWPKPDHEGESDSEPFLREDYKAMMQKIGKWNETETEQLME